MIPFWWGSRQRQGQRQYRHLPLCNCPHTEERKIKAALEAGAHTVMDLSIAGDLDALRTGMLAACPRPLGTVPLYAVGQRILDAGQRHRQHGPGPAV